MPAPLDVLTLGNAIVDIVAQADDDFLVAQGMSKGAMQLIDEDRAERLYAAMGPATVISGGSGANTAVGAASLGVRAAFIGYKSTQVEGVKVLAGQTNTVDIQLEQTAVEIQEITVVTQTQPLVPRDEVTSKQRIDGSFSDQLPVDRLSQVLTLQPGVVADSAGSGLSIRGGRADEAATYVDGVPVTPAIAAFLADNRAFVSLIGDGVHVAPEVAAVIARAAGRRLVLVSDAVAAAGAPPGRYRLGRLPVVSDGERVVVATTVAEPTVGLVAYDLRAVLARVRGDAQ